MCKKVLVNKEGLSPSSFPLIICYRFTPPLHFPNKRTMTLGIPHFPNHGLFYVYSFSVHAILMYSCVSHCSEHAFWLSALSSSQNILHDIKGIKLERCEFIFIQDGSIEQSVQISFNTAGSIIYFALALNLKRIHRGDLIKASQSAYTIDQTLNVVLEIRDDKWAAGASCTTDISEGLAIM